MGPTRAFVGPLPGPAFENPPTKIVLPSCHAAETYHAFLARQPSALPNLSRSKSPESWIGPNR